jgi:photosystem II stability/assembly factor-like uncharacterized protein
MKNSPKVLGTFAFISIVVSALAIVTWRSRQTTPGDETPKQLQHVEQTALLVQQPQAKKDHTPRKPAAHKPRREPEIENDREARPDHPDEAMRWRMMQMVDENGLIPDNALTHAWEESRQIPVDPVVWPKEQNLETIRTPDDDGDHDPNIAGIQPSGWTWLGPGNIGGRIRTILIHPTNSQIMYVGSVSGGIWKTTNGGTTWAPLNDFMGSLSVASLVMSPTDSNTIYAGTGEGLFTFNLLKDSLRGAGVFKSTDGGTTWSQLSATSNSDWFQVARLAINPSNGQILLAATGSGIWRTTDGGTTWSKRSSVPMLDINFHPTDGTKCIASGSNGAGAKYSTDGGQTWTSATGLPTFGRVEIAYAKSSPTTVYASVDNAGGEIYVSTDGGQTYSVRNTDTNYLNTQGSYDNIIWVDPTNSNTLIVGGIDLWRITNVGTTLTKISR